MKQILVVCSGNSFPQGAFNFLKTLQHEEPVSATGLFFSHDNEDTAEGRTRFSEQCTHHHILHNILDHEGPWNKNIFAKESRFSDLVLLSSQLFYAGLLQQQPNTFLSEAMHYTESPVLVIPEDFSPSNHLFIAYDGTKESLFAMKQFSYLFPHLTDLPTEVVYVNEETTNGIPELDHLRRYSRLHFSCMGFSKLHFKAAEYFATWIGERQHVMLISGSYGRSPFSYATTPSFAEEVIHDHRLPVFIAHP
ncbi:hypothetical protein ACQ86N_25430 [Puia sp. P3]|uniref:hypothetical protein n=1 Tax=Puia sp. P3 TaxID=3423952 RepID=UPI003D67F10D